MNSTIISRTLTGLVALAAAVLGMTLGQAADTHSKPAPALNVQTVRVKKGVATRSVTLPAQHRAFPASHSLRQGDRLR